LTKKRLNQFKKILEEKDCAGAFITSPSNMFYLAESKTAEYLFIPLDGEPVLLCLKHMGCRQVKEDTHIENVVIDDGWCTPPTNREYLPQYIDETIDILLPLKFIIRIIDEYDLTKSRIALDPYDYGTVEELKNKYQETSYIGVSDDLFKLRAVKDNYEIECIRKAVKITEKTIETVWKNVEEGVTENQLTAVAYKRMKELGANGLLDEIMGDFWGPTIVASGPNSTNAHHAPTDRKIKKGDFLKIDMGARYNGYNADITRTVVYGKASDKQKRMHHLLHDCQQAVIEAMAPGVETHDILWRGWEKQYKSEFANYSVAPMGHGIGLFVCELPSIELSLPSQKLVPGWVSTIEPGLYIPGLGGIRIEDDIVITKKSHESLSTLDRSINALKK
jgi:Xaa-Pro dipeptidase